MGNYNCMAQEDGLDWGRPPVFRDHLPIETTWLGPKSNFAFDFDLHRGHYMKGTGGSNFIRRGEGGTGGHRRMAQTLVMAPKCKLQ